MENDTLTVKKGGGYVKRILAVISMCTLLLCLCACGTQTALPTRTGFAMDTVVSITVYDNGTADAQAALDAGFAEIARLEALLSATVESSDISRINRAEGQTVNVAPETAEVLSLALQYAALSDGALDVTIRPVSALWDFSAGIVPDTTALEAAIQTVDHRHLTVDSVSVTLSKGAVDLGGIAKGYIGDRVAQVLRQHGVEAALIDLGGNIVTVGDKNGKPFQIGIKDPQKTDELCAAVQGSNCAVVTSGIYERGFDKDGVRYHHILDPKTGMPVQNTLASVTVLCETSADADALSTACFVLGEEKGRILIDKLDGVEALWVRRDGTIAASDGLAYTVL